MKWLVVAAFLAVIAVSWAENEVPVFVFGDLDSVSTPVLTSDAADNLESVLSDGNFKVIFIESQLSSDDFNHCNYNGKSCFSFLGTQSSKFYSPNIESPSAFLQMKTWEGIVENVNSEETIVKEAGKTVFVHFIDDDIYESHEEKLAAHDTYIKNLVAKLGTEQTTFVYTGIENSLMKHRAVRQTKQEEPEPEKVFIFSNGFSIISLKEIFVRNENGEGTNVTVDGITATSELIGNDTDTPSVKMSLNSALGLLELEIMMQAGRWWVEQISFRNFHYKTNHWIGAAREFSYSCSPTTRFFSPNVTDTLHIRGLQLEVNNVHPNDTMVFSDNWNCVGFTSGGIWGGLFVTFILLFILSIGLTWMLDINTMDRFDDPKGKTIIINASD